MKLIALLIGIENQSNKEVYILTREYSLDHIPYLVRNTAKEPMKFVVRESLKILPKSSRNTVEHEENFCHIQRDSEAIAAYAFCDKDYPKRIAYALLSKCLAAFKAKMGDTWKNVKEDSNFTIPEIKKLFEDYQNPSKVDKLTEAQQKIDDTKIVLHENMRKLLERQGDLDALVEKSKDLSAGAKQFYVTSKKMNKGCCSLI